MILRALILFICFSTASAKVMVNQQQMSVSGLSSGGHMATQLHMAYSDLFSGVGILAAGPYGCAQGNALIAQWQCMKNYWGTPQVDLLVAQTKLYSHLGKISNVNNLQDDRVFLFRGSNDETVLSPSMEAAKVFYQKLGVPTFKAVFDLPSGHAFPTVSEGHECELAGEVPWIAACNRNLANEMISFLLNKKIKNKNSHGDNYFRYQQESAPSMAEYGYFYIPKVCHKRACRLHVAIHGCVQSTADVDLDFVTKTGLNEVAEANQLIIMYPQAKKSALNPHGCWDWWGYTGVNYLWRESPQMSSIIKSIKKLIATNLSLESLQ